MLLIDGVRYYEWVPEKEVEEFHPLVKEHFKEIFGNNSMFIEGSLLKSEAGKGSIPDGFVIKIDEKPEWYIVEIELSTHELYDHIVNQVGRFINGIKNIDTQKRIIETIYHFIQDNKKRKAEFEEAISSGEIYKYISDLIIKPPILVIIIEERTRELNEALDLLRYSPIKVIEFRTYQRVGAEIVHAHLFEPLHKHFIITESQTSPQQLSLPAMDIKFWPSYRDYGYIGIWKKYRGFFPDVGENIGLIVDGGDMLKAQIGSQGGDSKEIWHLHDWYAKHPELKVGDILRITNIEPMKKYRLEIRK